MTRRGDRILAAIGSAFGLGYVPFAPGTAGALPGVAIFVVIAVVGSPTLHSWLIALSLLLVSVVTFAMSPWAERYWGKKDPGCFVLDEVAGFLFTVLLFRTPSVLVTVAWAFPVTRVIDILKPPPARQLERLPAGWGILADDLCSSLYAAAILHGAAACFPGLFGSGI